MPADPPAATVGDGRPDVGGAREGPADGETRVRRVALSPSRAGDFKTCPLLYRFRTVDRLPDEPGPEAIRGTLVHAVLEGLFALPAADRTEQAALDAVGPTWERISGRYPVPPGPVPPGPAPPGSAQPGSALPDSALPDGDPSDLIAEAQTRLRTYFALEDPSTLTSGATEVFLEVELAAPTPGPDGAEPVPAAPPMLLRGVLDRLDIGVAGAVRIVDYKSGKSPAASFEQSALFQLKFYALLLLRSRGVLARELKLLYLGDGTSLTYRATEEELDAFQRNLGVLWQAVLLARRTGEFLPRRGRQCQWCSFQQWCPEFGGTPPPYPFPDRPGDAIAPAPGPLGRWWSALLRMLPGRRGR